LILLVDQLGILLKEVVFAQFYRLLQGMNGFWAKKMGFPVLTPLIFTANIEGMHVHVPVGESVAMSEQGFFGNNC
jgi:hypothetical protein